MAESLKRNPRAAFKCHTELEQSGGTGLQRKIDQNVGSARVHAECQLLTRRNAPIVLRDRPSID